MRVSLYQRVILGILLALLGVPWTLLEARAITAAPVAVESTRFESAKSEFTGIESTGSDSGLIVIAALDAPSAEEASQTSAGQTEDLPSAETSEAEIDHGPIVEHPVTEMSGPDPLFDDELFDEQEDVYDPLEGMNRVFFGFNQYLDRYVWSPVTTAYQWLVPEPGRRAVRRAFRNLGSAPIFVNDLLQLRFRDAGETLGRFLLNSTVGMAGFFDAAVEAGWEYHHSDFGQTLAVAGVGKGPYLVLPILGPTTTRDGFGDIVDRAFEPLTYVFGFGLLGPTIQILIGAGNGVATREVYVNQLEALEESSVDFYAALRSVYVQNREAEIWAHRTRPPQTTDGAGLEQGDARRMGSLDVDAARSRFGSEYEIWLLTAVTQ